MIARGFISRERFGRLLERHDLAIDAVLAHAPRNQLRDLGAEIDNENDVVHWPICGALRAGSRPRPGISIAVPRTLSPRAGRGSG